jgi:hypothetical protein
VRKVGRRAGERRASPFPLGLDGDRRRIVSEDRNRKIETGFFNSLVYSMCRAISEAAGKDGAQKVLARSGELLLSEIRKGKALSRTNPEDALRGIADYLEDGGYVGKITVQGTGSNEYLIDMYDAPAHDSSQRLIAEGWAPSHVFTNTVFAALAEMGLHATLEHLDVSEPAHTRELWRLRKKT